jgi:hypothetical protein
VIACVKSDKSRNQISKREKFVSGYLRIKRDVQITLLITARHKVNLKEGDRPEAVIEQDGSICLVPNTAVDHTLAEQHRLDDVA